MEIFNNSLLLIFSGIAKASFSYQVLSELNLNYPQIFPAFFLLDGLDKCATMLLSVTKALAARNAFHSDYILHDTNLQHDGSFS